MLHVDDRVGSIELLPYFKRFGITAIKKRMQFGDVSWEGKGPNLTTAAITVERKTVDDLIQSMTTGRLSGHQIPGMADMYDYAYVVVEGLWKPGPEGETMVRVGDKWVTRRIAYTALTNYLMGLSLRAGINIWRSCRIEETVEFIVGQYKMWREPWLSHTSHLTAHRPSKKQEAQQLAGKVIRIEVGDRNKKLINELMIQEFHGIGEKVASKAAIVFPTMEDMVLANEEDWRAVVGKIVAKQIIERKGWKRQL